MKDLSEKELRSIEGGNPFFRKAAEWIISGAAWDAAKGAYTAALDGYLEACANGTYDGMPGYRR